jgi:hypothetical protein
MCFSDLTPWPPSLRGKGENLGGVARGEVNQKRWRTLSLRGWGNLGGPGGEAPMAEGCGGCPPTKSKGGELPTLATCPRVGPRTLANPKPTRVGKRGWRVRSPLPGGLGDVPPKNQNRGRAANSCHPATSGTLNAGKPSAHGGGKLGGSRGRKPPGRGFGGCAPKIFKEGASSQLSPPRHEWDPERWLTFSPRGWEDEGARGAKPPGRGLWGMCPHKFKRGGELPTLATPPRVGPRALANPKPTRVGKSVPHDPKIHPIASGASHPRNDESGLP